MTFWHGFFWGAVVMGVIWFAVYARWWCNAGN